MITAERLRELLDYDPETGIFTCLVSRGNRAAGSIAGSVTVQNSRVRTQYITIWADGRSYLGHQLAFIWMTGRPYPNQIDHKNGDGLDNRWSNLRETTYSGNATNRTPRRDNKVGATGVHFNKECKKWSAYISVNKKLHFLGYHSTIEQAIEVRRKAALELHGEFAGELRS